MLLKKDFRAWTGNEMLYDVIPLGSPPREDEDPAVLGDLCNSLIRPVKSVMQTIGIKDCNDKHIFEGDILVTNEGGWRGKVVYGVGYFLLVDNIGGFSSMPEWDKCEIIGNVFQNPELLDGEG